MHDIWNPWHGCRRCSEGCDNCYMYYLDARRGGDGSVVTRTGNFRYPLSRDRSGAYQVKSGELIRVCMTSDFFLEDADDWRREAWSIMAQRPDVKFFLLTKRPERVAACLPPDWGAGWEHVMLNVTCENQRRADERIPILLDLPFRHKGIMCAPMIGPVSIGSYLESGQLEQVLCDGESYGGTRPLDYAWVKALRDECAAFDVTFVLCTTGRRFIKDGKCYAIEDGRQQTEQAYLSGLRYEGRPTKFRLCDPLGWPIPPEQLYVPHYRARCEMCNMRLACNGCSDCGKCK